MKHTRTLMSRNLLPLLFAFAAIAPACKTEEKLPALKDQLAGPVDMATSPSGKYIYVLNSDYERRYNNGSIVVIDPDATDNAYKVNSFTVPRMGRSMHIAQNKMLVSYADSTNEAYGFLELFDLTDEKAPQQLGRWEMTCLPVNAIIAPTQPYFAVGCAGGDLMMGKGLDPRTGPVTIDKVRSYGYDRRAMYFYEGSKTWLLAFPTDFDAIDVGDSVYEDRQTYDLATDKMIDGPNGVPDGHENTALVRRRPEFRWPFQMVAYPVTDEEAASKEPQSPETPAFTLFRYVPQGTLQKPTQANAEQHYITYTLTTSTGLPTGTEGTIDATVSNYHTNFWEAKPSLSGDKGEFYLSQRGDYGAQSNNVLRLRLNDESLLANASSSFTQMFDVSRVYGFEIDRDNGGRYPGDFELATIGGESMMLINHFRDLIYFAGAPFYSVTRKFLDGPKAEYEQPSSRDSTQFESSFYQLAVSSSGKVLTASFYGNVLYLFDANPSISIKDQNPIRIE